MPVRDAYPAGGTRSGLAPSYEIEREGQDPQQKASNEPHRRTLHPIRPNRDSHRLAPCETSTGILVYPDVCGEDDGSV